MKILAIAQVEDRTNLDKQIQKQTIQPDRVVFYVDKEPKIVLHERRQRIAENHRKLKDIVRAYDCDYVFQLEQDGDYPENTLEKLIHDLEKVDKRTLGYISGIEVGRHGLYSLGVWVDISDNYFRSIDHNKKGIQEVDATGFYCLLAPKHAWLEGKVSWNGEPYGPDVNFGLSLKRKKYKIYADMDLHVGHIVKTGIIRPSDISTCNVEFVKRQDGTWGYKQLD